MELKHIKVFISAAEHLNFSKVAELSYISQPSVTKYIQALEGELGGKLFYRNSQKLELSDFGKAFLPYARELLATEQQSLAALDRFRSGLEYGRLNIGVDSTLYVAPANAFYEQLISALIALRCEHPGYEFTVRYEEPLELQKMLAAKQCDVALCLNTATNILLPVGSDVQHMCLDSCKNYLAVAKDTDMTGGIEGILSRVDCYTFEGRAIPQSINFSFANVYGVKTGTRTYPHWMELYMAIVLSHGTMATILPENMREVAEKCGMVMLELDQFTLESALYGLWTRSKNHDISVRFLQLLKKEFDQKKLPPPAFVKDN